MSNLEPTFTSTMEETPLPETERREITRLLRRLRRNNLTRQTVERLLRGELLTPSDILILAAVLHPARIAGRREKAAAAWALGWTRPDSGLLAEAREALEGILNNRRFKMLGWRLAVRFGILPYLLIPLGLIQDGRLNAIRVRAACSLGRLAQPESVAALAATLHDPRVRGIRRVKEEAIAALHSVLPLLTRAHYGTLPPETVPHLCRFLAARQWDEGGLCQLILQALEKVGGGNALEVVTTIAQSGTFYLQSEAVRILPVLEERARKEREARTLLRAADAPDAPSNVLLRAAQGSSEADPTVLLRAATPDEPS